MNLKQKALIAVFFGLTLLSTWVSDVQAFTLGGMRGGVAIGRALDLSITVQAASGEEVLASCFSAEVLYGDTPQQSVSLGLMPIADEVPPKFKLRIRTRAPVNEPTVAVFVRSTCVSSISRRYVILVDFPVAVMPQLGAPQTQTQTQAEETGAAPPTVVEPVAAAKIPAGVNAVSDVEAAVPPKTLLKAEKRALPKKVVRRSSPQVKAALSTAVPAVSVAPAQAVLRLEEVLTLPVGPVEPKAGVTLPLPWTQTSLQAKQIQTLQDQIKTLSEMAIKNNATLVQLQTQLQQAQSERISASLFYALGAVLLLLCGVLLWVLWQRYREQPVPLSDASMLTELILNSEPPIQEKKHDETVIFQTPSRASPYTHWPDVDTRNFAVNTNEEEVDLDIDIDNLIEANNASPVADFNSAAVLDIRQQADFFVSLGQTERALVILKKQIAESDKPNPLIYLDLLSLFHAQGYKTDFREYRTAFNRHFNCVLPDFPAYHLEGLELTAYPDELAHIAQVWNSQEAIAYLHDCIYRSEQASAQPSFELAAFRDLLLLYAIAQQLMDTTAS